MNNTLFSKEIYDLLDEALDESDIKAAALLAKISSRIVQYRIQNNMSQKELAQFLGVSQSMISKYEGRNYNYSIESLCKIFTKMNIDISINIGEEDNIKSESMFYEIDAINIPNESDNMVCQYNDSIMNLYDEDYVYEGVVN